MFHDDIRELRNGKSFNDLVDFEIICKGSIKAVVLVVVLHEVLGCIR